jgi:hypothetical protein
MEVKSDSLIKLEGQTAKIIVYPPNIDYYKKHTFKQLFDDYLFDKDQIEAKGANLRKTAVLQDVNRLQLEITNLITEKEKLGVGFLKSDL